MIKYEIKNDINKKGLYYHTTDIMNAVKKNEVFIGERFLIGKNFYPVTCVNIDNFINIGCIKKIYTFSLDQIFKPVFTTYEAESYLSNLSNKDNDNEFFDKNLFDKIDFVFIPSKEQVFKINEQEDLRFDWIKIAGKAAIVKSRYDNGNLCDWLLSPDEENGRRRVYSVSSWGTLREPYKMEQVGVPIFFQMTGGSL